MTQRPQLRVLEGDNLELPPTSHGLRAWRSAWADLKNREVDLGTRISFMGRWAIENLMLGRFIAQNPEMHSEEKSLRVSLTICDLMMTKGIPLTDEESKRYAIAKRDFPEGPRNNWHS